MSLKLRITMWFTMMILLLTTLVVTIVFVVADESLADDPIEELVKTVSRNAYILSKENPQDNEDYKVYHDGVYCQLMDEKGNCVKGSVPAGVKYNEPLQNGTVVTYDSDNGQYYIFDMQTDGTSWIRGYISTTEPSETTKVIVLSSVIILPMILLLSICGGWIITKRSLKSVDTVIEAVDSINSGEDLAARVNLKKGPAEIKKMSQEFDKMFARLEKSFEVEKQFASDVSHELKTPITIALGECHRMKKDITDEERHSSLQVVEKQCNRISELIESLLSITRLQHKTDKFPLKKNDISSFLAVCCEDYALEHGISVKGIGKENKEDRDNQDVSIKRKNICLTAEEGVFVHYNPSLMSRIIYNLLDNGRKYTSENGQIIVGLKSTPNGALISFEDDGIGISEEHLPNIWNRFWQADTSRGMDKGVGLGLAMVKEMVEFQNGKITVESQLGKGTKFYIELK